MNQTCGGVPNTTARGADLGLEESDGLGDVEDPLLVESKHLRGTRHGGSGEGRRGAGGLRTAAESVVSDTRGESALRSKHKCFSKMYSSPKCAFPSLTAFSSRRTW